MTKDFMRMIAVHEIGHALGLTGHSPYEEDVMFPALSNQRGITSRDVATLYKLYEIGGAAISTESSDLTDRGKIQLLFAEASKAKANNDTAKALEYFEQVLKIDSSNRSGRMLMACELNNMGLSKITEPVQALKYFRWASYFDREQVVYAKNISSCLFNLRIDESAASHLNQAQLCLTAKDYRGAVVEYRAALKLSQSAAIAPKLAEAEKLAVTQSIGIVSQ
jgi:tetratricopeptide (TPR) repeat protein